MSDSDRKSCRFFVVLLVSFGSQISDLQNFGFFVHPSDERNYGSVWLMVSLSENLGISWLWIKLNGMPWVYYYDSDVDFDSDFEFDLEFDFVILLVVSSARSRSHVNLLPKESGLTLGFLRFQKGSKSSEIDLDLILVTKEMLRNVGIVSPSLSEALLGYQDWGIISLCLLQEPWRRVEISDPLMRIDLVICLRKFGFLINFLFRQSRVYKERDGALLNSRILAVFISLLVSSLLSRLSAFVSGYQGSFLLSALSDSLEILRESYCRIVELQFSSLVEVIAVSMLEIGFALRDGCLDIFADYLWRSDQSILMAFLSLFHSRRLLISGIITRFDLISILKGFEFLNLGLIWQLWDFKEHDREVSGSSFAYHISVSFLSLRSCPSFSGSWDKVLLGLISGLFLVNKSQSSMLGNKAREVSLQGLWKLYQPWFSFAFLIKRVSFVWMQTLLSFGFIFVTSIYLFSCNGVLAFYLNNNSGASILFEFLCFYAVEIVKQGSLDFLGMVYRFKAPQVWLWFMVVKDLENFYSFLGGSFGLRIVTSRVLVWSGIKIIHFPGFVVSEMIRFWSFIETVVIWTLFSENPITWSYTLSVLGLHAFRKVSFEIRDTRKNTPHQGQIIGTLSLICQLHGRRRRIRVASNHSY